MDRADIVMFNGSMKEAESILEDSYKRRQYELENAIAAAAKAIAAAITRHAEVTDCIRICWEEQLKLAEKAKKETLDYLEARQAHDKQALATLRAMPAPRLVISRPDDDEAVNQ